MAAFILFLLLAVISTVIDLHWWHFAMGAFGIVLCHVPEGWRIHKVTQLRIRETNARILEDIRNGR